MNIPLPLIGCLSGIFLAVVLHKGTVYLRFPLFIKPVTVVGWLGLAFALFDIGCMIAVWWSSRVNRAPMGPFWGMLAAALLALVGVCCLLGTIQSRRYGLPWGQAFGVVITEVGFAIAVGWFLQENLYNFADVIRGGSREIPEILESYRRSREMLGWSHLALGFTLLLIEFAPPFPIRPGAKPPIP